MMEKKLPWIISAVLAGILIVVSFLWLDALSRLDSGNLSEQRDLIKEYCSKTDDESRARCQDELSDLETMLKRFANELRETPQATIQVSTTTATTTGQ